MSGTAAIKRPPQEDLTNPPKRLKEASELESRVHHFSKIIKNLGGIAVQSPEYGEALFTYISSNQATEETWEALFSALELPEKKLDFKEGKSVTLPLCLWNAHSTYFFHLFTLEMKQTPLEDAGDLSSIEALESFKMCLNTCTSASILNSTNWQELFRLAQKYQVLWLVKECENFLCENLSDFSEEDQQKLICFAAEFSLSKLLQTCLHDFVRTGVKVTDPELLKEMKEIADRLALADLKLYLSATLGNSLSISTSNLLSLQLESGVIESNKEEIKNCISGKCLWHSPQITLMVEDEDCLKADTLDFLLEENSTLVGLDLVVDPKGMEVIMERMKSTRELKFLDIYSARALHRSLGDESLSFLFNILRESFCLSSLTLSECIFDRQSASALQKFLINNPYLESFTLSDTNLEEKMIIALQKGCAANTQLTHLSIADCTIAGEASLSNFFTSLEGNQTLTDLNVGIPYNSDLEDDNPIPMLLEMLKKNRALKKLTIDSSEDFDINEILKVVMSEESSLEQLHFTNCKLKKIETVISIFEIAKNKPKKIFFENCEMRKIAYAQFLVEKKMNPSKSIIFLDNLEIEDLPSDEG